MSCYLQCITGRSIVDKTFGISLLEQREKEIFCRISEISILQSPSGRFSISRYGNTSCANRVAHPASLL